MNRNCKYLIHRQNYLSAKNIEQFASKYYSTRNLEMIKIKISECKNIVRQKKVEFQFFEIQAKSSIKRLTLRLIKSAVDFLKKSIQFLSKNNINLFYEYETSKVYIFLLFINYVNSQV